MVDGFAISEVLWRLYDSPQTSDGPQEIQVGRVSLHLQSNPLVRLLLFSHRWEFAANLRLAGASRLTAFVA